MTDALTHWIAGRERPGGRARLGLVDNPATGDVVAHVPMATPAEVDEAVAAAVEAAALWGRTSITRRAAVLFAFREAVHAHSDELAAIITREHGKVLSDAAGEVARGLENVEYATGFATATAGSFSPEVGTGVDVHSRREPLGVVAGITPFNFPVMVPLWMCANAIAAGNAFILKPSEKDPSASMLLARLWRDSGLPDGVFTVLHGDREAVDALIDHRDVAAVSFVGSTPVARAVHQRGTALGKRVQALGGAKNHMVVLPDADLGLAADAAVSAAYGSAGERCMAISVLVAVGDVGDGLVDAIRERVARLRVGDGSTSEVDMGPLITAEHRDRVASYVDAGAAAGARVVIDGREGDLPDAGHFLRPSLIDAVTPDMSVYTDEIFGPVLSVVRVPTFEEAVGLINANPYANGVAIFTRDGGAARQFEADVHVGMIGVNVAIPVPAAHFSFGGWKDSLFGDTHMYGPEGLAFFTRAKVVTTRWPDPSTSSVDLGFPNHRKEGA